MCSTGYPCLTARLADALEDMSSIAGAAQGAYEDLARESRLAMEAAASRVRAVEDSNRFLLASAAEAIAAQAAAERRVAELDGHHEALYQRQADAVRHHTDRADIAERRAAELERERDEAKAALSAEVEQQCEYIADTTKAALRLCAERDTLARDLEGERDDARAEQASANARAAGWSIDLEASARALAAARRDLAEYGSHRLGCTKIGRNPFSTDCSCGLAVALADAPTAPPSECPLEAHREMHNLPEHLFIEDFQRFCRVCGLTESHGHHAALTDAPTTRTAGAQAVLEAEDERSGMEGTQAARWAGDETLGGEA